MQLISVSLKLWEETRESKGRDKMEREDETYVLLFIIWFHVLVISVKYFIYILEEILMPSWIIFVAKCW